MSDDRLTIRLPGDIKDALEAVAAREDLTLSQLVRRMVRREVARAKATPKAAGKAGAS